MRVSASNATVAQSIATQKRRGAHTAAGDMERCSDGTEHKKRAAIYRRGTLHHESEDGQNGG